MLYFFRHMSIIALTLTLPISITPIFNAHKAGSWYPKDTASLEKLLQDMHNEAKKRYSIKTDASKIRALIAPHAGYAYSGKIAAAAYATLEKNSIDNVIILGPSHTIPFYGIALPTFKTYRTPLGKITINKPSIEALKHNSLVTLSNEPFAQEHSVELQMPFIQYSQPQATITPLIVGVLSDDDIKKIAELLKPLITKRTLIVVSTDGTHYGPAFNYIPFNTDILANIHRMDSALLYYLQKQDGKNFEKMVHETNNNTCGLNPLRILLELIHQKTLGDTSTRLIAYGTSYDLSKDENHVVTYAGCIVTNETDYHLLNQYEQTSLLNYARATLEGAFDKKNTENITPPLLTPLLEKTQGAFTTLWTIGKNNKKELRGCIGQIYPQKPLYTVVQETALDAAFKDSRFLPLQHDELPDIRIEISILTPPRDIASYKNIKLNKHGIILKNNGRSALFLPNVPEEFGFDLTKTLQELSLKAGLDKESWKLPSTSFLVFEAQIIKEQ